MCLAAELGVKNEFGIVKPKDPFEGLDEDGYDVCLLLFKINIIFIT